jgi:hypothetical protein
MAIPMYGQNKAGDSLGRLDNILAASKAWNPGSIADGDEEALEVTVPGAALGDFVLSSLSVDIIDGVLRGAVTAADTVTLIIANNTGGAIDIASGTANVLVIKA